MLGFAISTAVGTKEKAHSLDPRAPASPHNHISNVGPRFYGGINQIRSEACCHLQEKQTDEQPWKAANEANFNFKINQESVGDQSNSYPFKIQQVRFDSL